MGPNVGPVQARSACALVAATIAVTVLGCGGGSGGGGSSSSSNPKPLGQVSSCLKSAGFAAAPTPGVAHQLAVASPAKPQMTLYTVTVNKTAKDATQQVGDQKAEFGKQGADTGGGAVGEGRVVIAYARPVPKSGLDKVRHCAF
jgi:hypothetical protein